MILTPESGAQDDQLDGKKKKAKILVVLSL
jgi:hypothetical protein